MPSTTSTTGSALVTPSNVFGGTMLNSTPVTLPTIPNPTPPAPKKLAVITPALAQKDLSQKQNTTTQVSSATAQQTQANLARTAGVASPTQQNPQAQGNQQAPQGTNAAATTSTTPSTQNSTTSPSLSQVSLPNGMKANYNQQTGTLTTDDGRQLSWNASQNAWVDPKTGLPPQAPGAAPEPTGDPTTDYITTQLQKNQQIMDQATVTHQEQLQQILNGTFPLTADQQQQVANINGQFDLLKSMQVQANQNYTNAVTLMGIRNGQQQYSPALAAGAVNQAVSRGIQSLAKLNLQASDAVSQLKQGFMDNDYKVINESYASLQSAINGKNDTLAKVQDAVKNQVEIESARLQQQQSELTIQSTLVNNAAQATLQSALKADGTLDLDAIQQAADENGIDVQALYGAVEKARQQEVTFTQGEAKFASDQLQAEANLANTRANTAKTRQDMALNQPLDLSKVPENQKSLVNSFNSTLKGVPATSQAQARSTFNSLLNQGDVQGAKEYIIGIAASTLPAAQQTQVIGRSEAINALTDVQTLLDQAKANGNATNLVSGSLINVATKLGQSDDPDLQYIGNRIQQQLQAYRHAITGAAFTEAEMKQYQAIFPQITDANTLNTTKIQALVDGMNSNNRADLSFAVGATNYDKLFGANDVQLPSQKDAANTTKDSTYAVNGKTYVKGTDGLYYEQ